MSFKDNFGNPQGFIGKLMLIGMNHGHGPMAKWAFTQFEVPLSGKIVDVGCGGGYNLKRLLKASKDAMVCGVDISEVCVKKSESVNKAELNKRLRVYLASADKLPFKDNEIDLVTAFETVYFWKDLDKCFKEINRVLKVGGKFAIINDPGDPNKHWDEMIPDMTNWKAEELMAYMLENNFKDVKITKDKYKYCVIATKKS